MADANLLGDVLENGAIVSFVILSTHRSPDALVDAVGLPSDRSWRRDERKGQRSAAVHKFSGIEYRSQLPREAAVHRHVDDLLQRLIPVGGRLTQLARDLANEEGRDDRVRLWITRQVASGNAGFDVSVDQARFFGEIGAHIAVGIDLMFPPLTSLSTTLLQSGEAREV